MAKTNKFTKGDPISGKKWNGEHILAVYVHEYDCGDHLVTDGEKEFCLHKKDCHHANEEEAKTIQETIMKPMKEREKAKKKAQKMVEPVVEETPTEDEDTEQFEIAISEEEE
jgi:hypothetical protein